jgi:phage shock protein PspC (stress-responsive transcriptional regulator)
MNETRPCPYCAEEVPAAAVRCRYCRSRLGTLDPERWQRAHPERRLAGVAAAVAHGMALPIGAVRLAFLVLSFIHLVGLVLYGALWAIIPFSPGSESLLERGIRQGRALVRGVFGVPPEAAGGATGPGASAIVPGGPAA